MPKWSAAAIKHQDCRTRDKGKAAAEMKDFAIVGFSQSIEILGDLLVEDTCGIAKSIQVLTRSSLAGQHVGCLYVFDMFA